MPTKARWAAMTEAERGAYVARAKELRNARKAADPEWAERQREQEKDRYYRRKAENPDQLRANGRKSSAKHYANHVEERRAQRRAYGAANREQERARQREYAKTERGREVARLNAKAYRERNPSLSHIRAWRQRGARSDAYVWVSVLLQDPCCYCGAPMEEVDHIVPVTRGGDGDWSNLTAACRSCNRSKKNHSLLHWLAKAAA